MEHAVLQDVALGVCIQLLAESIQKAEISVPSATIQADSTCTGAARDRAPQHDAMKPASRKKAVSTS